ncbi:hypothetical protein SH501x_003195 [Pirellulaceae bacterium SH501]
MPDLITFGGGATITTFSHQRCCGYRLALIFKAGGGGGPPNSTVQAVVQIAFSSPSELPPANTTLGRGHDASVFTGASPFRPNSDSFALTLGNSTIKFSQINHDPMGFMQQVVGKDALTVFTFACQPFDHLSFAADGSTLKATCSTLDNLKGDRNAASGLISWRHQLPAVNLGTLEADRNRIIQAPYQAFADGSDKICWNLVQSRGCVAWDTGRTNQNSVVDFLLKQMGMGPNYGFVLTYKLNSAAGAMSACDTIDASDTTTSLNYILYEEASGVFEKINAACRFEVKGGRDEQPPSDYLELNRSVLGALPVSQWDRATGVKERVYLVSQDPHWNWPRFR